MESELIAWLRAKLPPHPLLRLGVGDDAAVLDLASGRCVVTVDLLTDGVDFLLSEIDPRRAGHKALGVNLSDLAAMAAEPRAVVIALALPRSGALELAQRLYEGLLPLAERFDVAIAGGDTNTWDGPLAMSVTALGEPTARGPLLRSGARPGDALLVTGRLGGSLLGRHLDVEPRVAEALLLHERYTLHAAIDISDGLARDASRLGQASRCGVVLDRAALPLTDAARRMAAASGKTPAEHALYDGEDFELVLALPPDEAARALAEQPLAVPLTQIGTCIAEPGLWEQLPSGTRVPLVAGGFEH